MKEHRSVSSGTSSDVQTEGQTSATVPFNIKIRLCADTITAAEGSIFHCDQGSTGSHGSTK